MLQAFYIHLQYHFGTTSAGSVDVARARSEVIDLLEKTFYDKGGDKAAYAMARDGTEGGMPSVLNMLTEHYKAERKATYIKRVFKDGIDALDWEERVDFMRGAMKRMGPFLPEELRDQPPERFARDCEPIVRIFVESIDNIKQFVRTM